MPCLKFWNGFCQVWSKAFSWCADNRDRGVLHNLQYAQGASASPVHVQRTSNAFFMARCMLQSAQQSLQVSRHLFRWTKEIAYADYYERALINGVLSIQRGRDPGVMIYMLPQGPGRSKAMSYHGWGTQFNSFWCCYGTGKWYSSLSQNWRWECKFWFLNHVKICASRDRILLETGGFHLLWGERWKTSTVHYSVHTEHVQLENCRPYYHPETGASQLIRSVSPGLILHIFKGKSTRDHQIYKKKGFKDDSLYNRNLVLSWFDSCHPDKRSVCNIECKNTIMDIFEWCKGNFEWQRSGINLSR